MIDPFGRSITYFRISVTDRCNLRGVYCMPAQGVPWKPVEEILSYEEITRVVRAAARLGIRYIRLTGGEPLVRRNLPDLVGSLNSIPGIEEVSLTTNGILLEKLAKPLAEAGLKRVNVSLDTLDAKRFGKITQGGDINRVWDGIAAAEQANLHPVKINTVVIRGINDDELLPLARLTLEHEWHVRFIELMPIGSQQGWDSGFPSTLRRYISAQEMRRELTDLDLQPADSPSGNGPSRTFRIPGAKGTVGFVSPLSEHFCASCNRLRLTADGRLRSCLFSESEVDVRVPSRRGEAIEEYLGRSLRIKPENHGLNSSTEITPLQNNPVLSRVMSQIGG